jgi:hypothetical protein
MTLKLVLRVTIVKDQQLLQLHKTLLKEEVYAHQVTIVPQLLLTRFHALLELITLQRVLLNQEIVFLVQQVSSAQQQVSV